jgi:tRNA dimethylallyltransferase
VGGTAYWIQHLLFPERLTSSHTPPISAISSNTPTDSLSNAVNSLPEELRLLYDAIPDHPLPAAHETEAALNMHNLLSALDPDVAARWHWKDVRKVHRSLIIIKENGRRNSEIIAHQSKIPLQPR